MATIPKAREFAIRALHIQLLFVVPVYWVSYRISRRLYAGKLGWTMGLEPTTTGITIRGSTN